MVLGAPKQKMSVREYLVMERAASEKHIYWDGEVFAMAGASRVHNLLVAAVLRELGVRLRKTSCQPFASDQRVRFPSKSRYVYPDASVTCQPVELDPEDAETITNPRLIVEVLSDSTEAFDRGAKFVGYRSLPSLVDYLLVSQHERRVEHYARQDDGSWALRTHEAGDVVRIASPSIELPIDELFEGILPSPSAAIA